MKKLTKAAMKHELAGKLRRHFGKEMEEASREQVYQACALVLRDLMAQEHIEAENERERRSERQVHYISMEFLLGRSLRNNAFNLGVLDVVEQALGELGYTFDELCQVEADAALGNGGLGRLAACYLDSMATLGLHASGYTIRYAHGIFKQKIIDGKQVEMTDDWLDTGDVWQLAQADDAIEVRLGGSVEQVWQNDRMVPVYRDYTPVLALPHDMLISGYGTDNVARLRLWEAASPVQLDMSLFSRGEYLKAVEQRAMAEVISAVLYPEDNHVEGQSLRLKQQYFLVSATVQDIVRRHKREYGTLRNFHEKNVIHINDTHPTMVLPELMRLLLDEEHMGWEEAWEIVRRSVAYTNHTVMAEALECWHTDQMQMLVPRVFQIICEIDRRFCETLRARWPGDWGRVQRMAIIQGGVVRMANLAVAGCYSVNGVSELHSNILKEQTFRDFYQLEPEKFHNVTNGIAHRRWLCQANPELDALIRELIGDGYRTRPEQLDRLAAFAGDKAVLEKLGCIKADNKARLARYLERSAGVRVNVDSLFDIQVKRLHEYKRQLLNVLHILSLWHQIQDNPSLEMTPHTFFFGSKAAPGYAVAKRIIQLIHSVAAAIVRDPAASRLLQVVFMEDYRVSLAELIMPAAELSEQISLAGTEASGTGNMKFMINGALTIGTMDVANIEICQAAGRENLFIFGMDEEQVKQLQNSGQYSPTALCQSHPQLQRILDQLSRGFGDGESYGDLAQLLLTGAGGAPDRYFLLADFDSYAQAQARAQQCWREKEAWNRMSLFNIAGAGRFAADRSIRDYAREIWRVPVTGGR